MRFWLLILFFSLVCFSFTGFAEEAAIILSADLRPYIEVVEGYKASCGKNFKMFHVKKVGDLRNFKIVVALGVSAFNYVNDRDLKVYKIYSLLIYPVEGSSFLCGIYLQPDPELVLDFLLQRRIKKVAVFYSVSESQNYVFKAFKEARKRGMVLLPVNLNKYSLEEAIAKIKDKISLIWVIPDPAVASESVVSFIIKRALSYRIPVMGYNNFFCDEGALFCLNIDYFETGRRLCSMIKKLSDTGVCESFPAVFKIKINEKAYEYFMGKAYDSKK